MHTEKVGYQILGDWLDGSGWTTILTNAGVLTTGTANSLINVSHICRARYAHQVTAVALPILKARAYKEYTESLKGGEVALSMEKWLEVMTEEQPQVFYWETALEIELLVLEVGMIRL